MLLAVDSEVCDETVIFKNIANTFAVSVAEPIALAGAIGYVGFPWNRLMPLVSVFNVVGVFLRGGKMREKREKISNLRGIQQCCR